MKFYLFTLFVALFVIPQSASAEVEIGDLYYNLHLGANTAANTAEVTYFSLYAENWAYVGGDLIVPGSVDYDGHTYKVTAIGHDAFQNCKNLTSVTIPNSVLSIGYNAFVGCSKLTTVTMSNSVMSIGSRAFDDCDKLTKVIISDALQSCAPNTFPSNANIVYDDGTPAVVDGFLLSKDRKTLYCLIDESSKVVTIPNTVTTIGIGAFSGRDDLTSVSIPNSVTTIGNNAFQNCSGLTEVSIPNSVTEIGDRSFMNCRGLTEVTIPNSVTQIGSSAFRGCSGLTSLAISNTIKVIEESTFAGCSKLPEVTIPNSVETIREFAFSNTGLKSLTIPKSVKAIGSWAFRECIELSTIYLYSDCFDKEAFDEGFATAVYCHPSIYNAAKNHFKGNVYCLAPYTLSTSPLICGIKINVAESEIPGIGEFETTSDKIAIYDENDIRLTDDKNINKGSELTFTGLKPDTKYKVVYSTVNSICSGSCGIDFKTVRPSHYLYCKTHQTSIVITDFSANSDESIKPTNLKVGLGNDIYDYKKNLTIKDLEPGTRYNFVLYADYNGTTVSNNQSIKTKYLTADAYTSDIGPTSVTLKGKNNSEAKVVEEKWLEADQTGTIIQLTGLDPKTQYKYTYQITTEDGNIRSDYVTFTTSALTLTTLQPRCATASTAIVAAETNISDAEPNVGFQWRKYDAPESLKSSEGYGAVYSGVAEGYLRNLQPVYYNVRAFYKSTSGKYYYSDWVTFDPTDFSYFEPTVHTYPVTSINDFNATLKGYVMNGSDEIKSQGFEYWPTGTPAKTMAQVPVNSADVQTVLAKGQVMVAEISGLLADTEYTYRAFAETSSGIIYGEEQTFRTTDTSGIESITVGGDETTIIGYYDINGRRYNSLQRGLNIIVYSNGKIEKRLVR